MTTAIVIGGGIAGCSTAYALSQRGIKVTLVEQHAALAQEASGNPVAMLYPKLSIIPTAPGELAFAGFLFTQSLLKKLSPTPTFYQLCGLLQLAFDQRESIRQQQLIKIAAYMSHIQALDAAAASKVAGVKLIHNCLYFAEAGWVKPQLFCQALVNSQHIKVACLNQTVSVQQQQNQWSVEIAGEASLLADVVIICNANAITRFKWASHLPVTPVRGQLNFFAENTTSRTLSTIVCSDHFLSPAVDGWHSLGTSYAPNEMNPGLSLLDTQHNLAALKTLTPAIYGSIEQEQIHGRVGWRSTTPDYLPLAGQLLDHEKLIEKPPRYNAKAAALPWLNGLYVNAGHGSKGMITAPICAELIANLIMRPTLNPPAFNLPTKLSSQLNPSRFLLRKLGLKQLAQNLY